MLAAVSAWERVVENYGGVKLLLTATPSGANRDPQMLLRLLKYLPPERGAQNQDRRDPQVWQQWFEERDDGLGYKWRAGARQEFEEEWLRARVSFISLRFDKRVFPRIETRCSGASSEKQCVYEIGDSGLQLINRLPTLSEADQNARRMLDYARMAPMIVQVPLLKEEVDGLLTKIRTASLNTRNPELAACTKLHENTEEFTDEQIEQCAAYAHYEHKKGGGQWASGGGFDIKSKMRGVRRVIDMTQEPGRHVIVASGYEGASTRYFQGPLLDEFTKKSKDSEAYTRILKKDVQDDGAMQRLMSGGSGNQAKRLASLTGTTYARTSQSKTAGEKQRMKEIFFSDANADGSIIKVLVVDASMLTGFDAKGARYLHILSPVLNQQQAWSRILRRCAQPVKDAIVYVFTYVSYIPQAAKEKQNIYVTPDQMILDAMQRRRQIVQPIDLMREAMRQAAYDHYFFADYSSGGADRSALGDDDDDAELLAPLTQNEYVVWRLLLRDTALDIAAKPDAENERREAANALAALFGGGTTSSDSSPVTLLAGMRRNPPASAAQMLSERASSAERSALVFADRFFVPDPWKRADPSGVVKPNENNAARLLASIVDIVSMNKLIDLALLEKFIDQKLSKRKIADLLQLLNKKAAITPKGLLDGYQDYLNLQVNANKHYRDVIIGSVSLVDGTNEATQTLRQRAQSLLEQVGVMQNNDTRTARTPPMVDEASEALPNPLYPALEGEAEQPEKFFTPTGLANADFYVDDDTLQLVYDPKFEDNVDDDTIVQTVRNSLTERAQVQQIGAAEIEAVSNNSVVRAAAKNNPQVASRLQSVFSAFTK